MARGLKLQDMSVEDINRLTLEEANKLIRESAADLNRRVESLKHAKAISKRDAENALRYLQERARASRPAAKAMGQPRLKRAQFSRQASRTLAGARSRLKEMKAAAESKTSIRGVQSTNRKRRETFGDKFGLDRPLTDKEMATLGKAINKLKKEGFDSEQVVEVYRTAIKAHNGSIFQNADALADFTRDVLESGGIPSEEIEEIVDQMNRGETLKTYVDESGEVHYMLISKTGEVREL